jgi:hypothetical protein
MLLPVPSYASMVVLGAVAIVAREMFQPGGQLGEIIILVLVLAVGVVVCELTFLGLLLKHLLKARRQMTRAIISV